VAVITLSDAPSIRAAILVDLQDHQLPDDIIALPIYLDRANDLIVERDPDAETRTGSELKRIRRAAVFICAALLCPAVSRATSVSIQTRDVSYSRPAFDATQRAAELMAMAEDEIQAVLAPSDETPGRPTMFALAAGRRGQ